MTDRPAMDRAALMRHLRLLLPPHRTGVHALLAVVAAVERLEAEFSLAQADREHALMTSYGGALDQLGQHLRRRVGGIRDEDVADALAETAQQVDRIYLGCGDRQRFGAYLRTALANRARGDHRKEHADRREVLDPESPPAEPAPVDVDRQAQAVRTLALRRFAWWHWGSPDHPKADSKKTLTVQKARAAVVEFTAVSCNLEARPYRDLVRHNQPQPGDWGEGDPRPRSPDDKWWNNRAGYARGKLKTALNTRAGAAQHTRILRGLGWTD